jgi:hypothetical protein
MMTMRRRQFLGTMLCVVPITAWAGIVKRRKSDALVYAPNTAAFLSKKSTAAASESLPEFPTPEIAPPKPRTVRRAVEPAAVNETVDDATAAESEEVIRFDHTKK